MQTSKHDRMREGKLRHCNKRLMERFGIKLSREELEDVSIQIDNYDFKPIWISPDNGRSFHLVTIYDQIIIFLYDWEYACVLTVYRKNWFKYESGSYAPDFYKIKSKEQRKLDKAKTYAIKNKQVLDLLE